MRRHAVTGVLPEFLPALVFDSTSLPRGCAGLLLARTSARCWFPERFDRRFVAPETQPAPVRPCAALGARFSSIAPAALLTADSMTESWLCGPPVGVQCRIEGEFARRCLATQCGLEQLSLRFAAPNLSPIVRRVLADGGDGRRAGRARQPGPVPCGGDGGCEIHAGWPLGCLLRRR